jgi:hypothetical protein
VAKGKISDNTALNQYMPLRGYMKALSHTVFTDFLSFG